MKTKHGLLHVVIKMFLILKSGNWVGISKELSYWCMFYPFLTLSLQKILPVYFQVKKMTILIYDNFF